MIWQSLVLLIRSIMQARVVDLPVPAEPVLHQAQHFLRDPQLLRIRKTEFDHSDHRGQRATLAEHVDPETAQMGNGDGEVVIRAAVQVFPVTAAGLVDRVDDAANRIRHQNIP